MPVKGKKRGERISETDGKVRKHSGLEQKKLWWQKLGEKKDGGGAGNNALKDNWIQVKAESIGMEWMKLKYQVLGWTRLWKIICLISLPNTWIFL